MKVVFLLVTFCVQVVFSSDHEGVSPELDNEGSSPEVRIFRTLSNLTLKQASDVESNGVHSDGVHSDPDFDISSISIPEYLSSLGASDRSVSSVSSSGSTSHSDSDNEKCAISDNDLIQMAKLMSIITNKIYGTYDFQDNVYGALDLYRLSFDPKQGKTLGDMLGGLLERQKKLHVDVHTLQNRAGENERERVLSNDIEALKDRVMQQEESMQEMFLRLRDLQVHVVDFKKEMDEMRLQQLSKNSDGFPSISDHSIKKEQE